MSDIRGGSNLPHIAGTLNRVAPPPIGVNLAQFGDKWSNSKTQISILDFGQICGRLDPPHQKKDKVADGGLNLKNVVQKVSLHQSNSGTHIIIFCAIFQ